MVKVLEEKPLAGDLSSLIVSTKQVAGLLSVSTRKIQISQNNGWIKSISRGKWILGDVIAGLEKERKDTERQSSKSASASRATDARTKEIEFRIERQQGKFVPIVEFESLFDEVVGEFLTTLSGFPARITRNKRERDRIEAIIDQERARLSGRFAKKIEAVLPDSGPDSTKRAA